MSPAQPQLCFQLHNGFNPPYPSLIQVLPPLPPPTLTPTLAQEPSRIGGCRTVAFPVLQDPVGLPIELPR